MSLCDHINLGVTLCLAASAQTTGPSEMVAAKDIHGGKQLARRLPSAEGVGTANAESDHAALPLARRR